MKDTLSFRVEGMTCGGCARTVRLALESVPGVTAKRVIAGEPVEISIDGSAADRTAVKAAVEKAGYRPIFDA